MPYVGRPSVGPLPIEAHLPAIESAVLSGPLVLTAAPGAGKSSLVPFAVDAALRSISEQPGRVVMLQPRRLAARATATRLADLRDEPLGRSIGMTMRGERVRGERIEVVTEAVLTNRLHQDPELEGIGAVIFDEFHERNLHSDLGLAMALEAQDALRPDLRIVVMSATIDPEPIAERLGPNTTIIDVEGRVFPVETEHRQRPSRSAWPAATAQAVEDAAGRVAGDVLVFAPGRAEIDAVIRELRSDTIGGEIVALHGSSPSEVHRSVLGGSDTRRIIVATAIAETSVTIPGIEAVVDGGLARRPKHDPATATNHLVTEFVSRFSAEQRRGRAGRTQAGICIRLWSAADHGLLDDQAPPEITDGDPIQIAAELLRWGDPDGVRLPLLDRPEPVRLGVARQTMAWWGITDGAQLTDRGSAILSLPVHPRIGALLSHAAANDDALQAQALDAAAVLEDTRFPNDDDLEAEVKRRRNDGEIRRAVRRLRPLLSGFDAFAEATQARPTSLPQLMAVAWPDRIALSRPGDPSRLLMANGREVRLEPNSQLVGAEAYVVVDATVVEASGRVRRAVPIERSDITRFHEPTTDDVVDWNRSDALVATRQRRHGAITLHSEPLASPPPGAIFEALQRGIRQRGLDVLRWSDSDRTVRRRLAWLHHEDPAWPDVSDDALLNGLDQWLDLTTITSVGALRSIGVGAKLLDLLDWQQRASFGDMAPTELPTPSGRTRRIDWSGERPTWPVRVQDLFGLDTHPTIGPGNAALTIELLSPAGRTTQTTTDLPGFWRGSYAAVRADLRGRYPKHAWPENPLA